MGTVEQHKPELPLLSVRPEKASEMTDTSRTRIFQAIRDGELTARKAGKSTIIEVDELRRWVRSLPTRGRKPVDENPNIKHALKRNSTSFPPRGGMTTPLRPVQPPRKAGRSTII